jgi:hypothetical protein
MEMVKYFAMAAAIAATLTVADLGMARGRHGCASCGVAVSGCPGGVCYAPVGAVPTKMAAVDYPATAVMAMTVSAPPVVSQPAPRYYPVSARRGLFGWRR